MQTYLTVRQDFINRHGGKQGINAARREYVMKGDEKVPTGYWLFPDGAKLDNDAGGQNFEPPEDPIKLLKLLIKYHEVIQKEAVADFHQFKNMVNCFFDPDFRGSYAGPTYTGTEAEAMSELKSRKRRIWKLDRALDNARAELEELINPPAKREMNDCYEQEISERRSKFLKDVRKAAY